MHESISSGLNIKQEGKIQILKVNMKKKQRKQLKNQDVPLPQMVLSAGIVLVIGGSAGLFGGALPPASLLSDM